MPIAAAAAKNVRNAVWAERVDVGQVGNELGQDESSEISFASERTRPACRRGARPGRGLCGGSEGVIRREVTFDVL